MGTRGLWRGVPLLAAAIAFAGSASAAPPPWANNRKDNPQESRPDDGFGRPTLVGVITAISRDGRTLDVRTSERTYRVDISERPDSERRSLRRDTRVLVWGQTVRGILVATRLQAAPAGWRPDDRDDRPDERPNPWDRRNEGKDPWDRRDDGYTPRPGTPPQGGWPPADRREERLDGVVKKASAQLFSRSITITAGGSDWSVEVPKETRILRGREGISVHGLKIGESVRISGERTGDRKFRATSITVGNAQANEPRYDTRPGYDTRPTHEPRPADELVYTGSIRDIDSRAGTFLLRLNTFESYTIRATATTVIRRNGRNASLRDLRPEDRVRVTGTRDTRTRTMDARAIEIL